MLSPGGSQFCERTVAAYQPKRKFRKQTGATDSDTTPVCSTRMQSISRVCECVCMCVCVVSVCECVRVRESERVACVYNSAWLVDTHACAGSAC